MGGSPLNKQPIVQTPKNSDSKEKINVKDQVKSVQAALSNTPGNPPRRGQWSSGVVTEILCCCILLSATLYLYCDFPINEWFRLLKESLAEQVQYESESLMKFINKVHSTTY